MKLTKREQALKDAMAFIQCIPQAYHARGPEVCRDLMWRCATEALLAHTSALAIDAATQRREAAERRVTA